MTKIFRHGDVLIREVTELPKEARKVETSNKYTVAEGEATGHHHVITKTADTGFEVYTVENQTYLKINQPTIITHEEHKPLIILPAIYVVGEEQEFDYFLNDVQRVQD